jgi:hypothetical protein
LQKTTIAGAELFLFLRLPRGLNFRRSVFQIQLEMA